MYEMAKESHKKSRETIEDMKIRRFFDALLMVRSKIHSAGDEKDSVQPSRRIIYLRDFGSIAPAGKLLLVSILRAMEHLCQSESTPLEPSLSPTILIFGVAEGIELISRKDDDGDHDDSNADFRKEWHTVLRTGGQVLKEIMPELHYKFPSTRSEKSSCSRLSPLSAQFFLPLVYNPSELSIDELYENTGLCKGESELISCDAIFSIFPKNVHSEEFSSSRRISIQERTKEINEALLRLFIGKRGGSMEGKLSSAISESNDNNKRQVIISLSYLSVSLLHPHQSLPFPILVPFASYRRSHCDHCSWPVKGR